MELLEGVPAPAQEEWEEGSDGDSETVVLASVGLRSSAFLLDYIITLLIPATTLLIAVYFKRRWSAPGLAGSVLVIGYLLTVGLILANLIVLCKQTGQTLGKRFLGIRIIRADGQPISFRTVILRHLVGYPLSLLFGGLGIIWALWDQNQQGWHDKLAKTFVVKD